jgi:lipoate-protein ligase A
MRPIPCRWINDDLDGGAWNMAVDEVLLERAAEGICTLRFYGWSEPTLSLGYFQAAADRQWHAPSLSCPLVRRDTGGGAILHDCELTYSLAIFAVHPLAANARALYRAVHNSLIECFRQWGIRARLFEGNATPPERNPFLCFQRRSEGDVLAGEAKIAGSAQRRRRGAVLQHGSILLATSRFAPELPGLNEQTAVEVAASELAPAWAVQLKKWLSMDLEESNLTEAERSRAMTLERGKYVSLGWNGRR